MLYTAENQLTKYVLLVFKANSYAVGSVNRKRAISDRRPNRAFLRSRKSAFFDPNFFDRAIRSTHPVEKVDFFNGMHESDCPIETVFEAHRISHRPRKHTIAPYNSSVAGLTATAAAAAAVLALATLHEFQRHNRDDEGDEGSPRAK